MPEAFQNGRAEIPASVLRERLPHTLTLVEERERTIYDNDDEQSIAEVKQSFTDFVELCEHKEQETGQPVTIIASF